LDDCLGDLLFFRVVTHFDRLELESVLVALIGQNIVVGSILDDSLAADSCTESFSSPLAHRVNVELILSVQLLS